MKFSFKMKFSEEFLALLSFLATQKGLAFGSRYADGVLEFFVRATQEEAVEFAEFLSQNLPHSLFLEGVSAEVFDGVSDEIFDGICTKSKFENLTPFNVSEVSVEAESEAKECAKSVLLGGVASFDGLAFCKFDGENFGDFLVPTNGERVGRVFVASEEAVKLLMAYEKPVLRLKTSAVFRTNHENAPLFAGVRLFWSAKTKALCEACAGVCDFLSVSFLHEASEAQRASVLRVNFFDGKILDLDEKKKNFKPNTAVGRFCEAGVFVASGEREFCVVRSEVPRSFEEICEAVCKFENGEKLVENFRATFGERAVGVGCGESAGESVSKEAKNSGKFEFVENASVGCGERAGGFGGADSAGTDGGFANSSFGESCKSGVNLDKFEFGEKVGGFDTLFEELFALAFRRRSFCEILDLADDFAFNKALGLDFVRGEDGTFEWARLARGVMSYALAGVDERVLAFGLVAGLARFYVEMGEMCSEDLGVGEFVLEGVLRGSKKFASVVFLKNDFGVF